MIRNAPPRVEHQIHLIPDPPCKTRATPVTQIDVSHPTPPTRVASIPDPSPPRVPPSQPPPAPTHVQHEPTSHRTCSWQALANIIRLIYSDHCKFPMDIINKCPMPVLNGESGNLMEYRQLCKQPKFADIGSILYSN